jgi:plastocyanin
MSRCVRATLVALSCVVGACSSGNESTATGGAAAPAAAPVTVSGPRTITGRVPVPDSPYPAIVIFEPQAPDASPQPAVPYMDQVQQTFIPQVLFVRTGQPVEFRNNDDVLHNVRVHDASTRTAAFNISIPNGDKFNFVFQKDGFYDVGCDIHPAMGAQIISTTSPFAVAADPQGQFAIDAVPEGTYTASVYSGSKHLTKSVTIGSTNAPLDLTE